MPVPNSTASSTFPTFGAVNALTRQGGCLKSHSPIRPINRRRIPRRLPKTRMVEPKPTPYGSWDQEMCCRGLGAGARPTENWQNSGNQSHSVVGSTSFYRPWPSARQVGRKVPGFARQSRRDRAALPRAWRRTAARPRRAGRPKALRHKSQPIADIGYPQPLQTFNPARASATRLHPIHHPPSAGFDLTTHQYPALHQTLENAPL